MLLPWHLTPSFARLQGDGVRFQVCLPTPVNVIACNIQTDDQVRAEPLYEAALLPFISRFHDHIPAQDLTIQ